MSLVKHSQRTVRKPCKGCGRTGLYWYHDTSREGRRRCDKTECPQHGKTSAFVLVDKDTGLLHKRSGNRCEDIEYKPDVRMDGDKRVEDYAKDLDDAAAEAKPEAADIGPERAAAEAQANASVDPDDKLQALRDLLGPSVDQETVKAWVREALTSAEQELKTDIAQRLAEVEVPVRVVVNDRDRDEDIELPDVCHSVLPDVITLLDRGHNVWLVGPAGTGKTTIAKQAAEALDLPFYAKPLAPDMPTSRVFGYQDANGRYVSTVFRTAYEDGGLFLFDEVDNGNASILAGINMAIENGTSEFPDGMIERSPRFRCIAAGNTHGTGPDRTYIGRQALDGATLDRFTEVEVDVDPALERRLVLSTGITEDQAERILTFVRRVRDNVTSAGLPIVVSPRASARVADMIVAGMDTDVAVSRGLRKGLSDAEWSKITEGASL